MEKNYRRIEKRDDEIRTVPAFTIQAYQKNTKVGKPPKCDVFKQKPVPPSKFRFYYDRRDLPVALDYSTHQPRIKWLANIKRLDHEYYLPLFFLGLSEISHPYQTLVNQGIFQIIENANSSIIRCLPQLAQSIKNALKLNHPKVICNTCKVVKKLTTHSPLMGIALVKYYADILPVLRIFKEKNENLGDIIEYGQRKRAVVGDVILDTLEHLERTGGEGAYDEIKYIVPTYTSIVNN